jgi:CheY-like chemotaxis protein
MTRTHRSAPIRVLIVEDNPDDAELTLRALRVGKIHNEVHVEHDGAGALAYLRSGAAGGPPDLVLLDLDLPGTDGRAVLQAIKADPALQHIPVIIISGSTAPDDVARSYQQHANAFIHKPIDAKGFLEVVNSIERFWLDVVRLPHA